MTMDIRGESEGLTGQLAARIPRLTGFRGSEKATWLWFVVTGGRYCTNFRDAQEEAEVKQEDKIQYVKYLLRRCPNHRRIGLKMGKYLIY